MNKLTAIAAALGLLGAAAMMSPAAVSAANADRTPVVDSKSKSVKGSTKKATKTARTNRQARNNRSIRGNRSAHTRRFARAHRGVHTHRTARVNRSIRAIRSARIDRCMRLNRNARVLRNGMVTCYVARPRLQRIQRSDVVIHPQIAG